MVSREEIIVGDVARLNNDTNVFTLFARSEVKMKRKQAFEDFERNTNLAKMGLHCVSFDLIVSAREDRFGHLSRGRGTSDAAFASLSDRFDVA